MKLWLRVALVTALVSIASLLLTGVVAQRVAGDAATETAIRAQERDAAAIAASVQRWVDDRQSAMLGWALAFPLAELDAERQRGLVRGVLKAISSAVIVTLVDGDGQEVVEPAYFPPDAVPLGAIAGSPDRARHLIDSLPVTAALGSPSDQALGVPYLVDGRPMVPVAVVASRRPPLVLGAELSLEIAEDLRAQSGRERVVALLDAADQPLTGADPRMPSGRLGAVLGTTASVQYVVDGVDLQGAVAPVGTTGWSVVIVEPAAVALEGARRIRFLLPFVVGGAMVLAVLLGLVLGRTITVPIERLRTSVLAVAEGRLGVRAEVAGSDEVGELARAFNHMSVRLLDNQEEIGRQREAIESFNLSLQSEIEEATRDLREAQGQLVRSGQLAAVAQIGAGLAHELNNPLTAVLGLTQILASREVPEVVRKDLEDLQREALRCREVVEAMLRLTATGETEQATCSPTDLTDDVARMTAPTLAQRGVRLHFSGTPGGQVQLPRGPGANAIAQLVTGLAAGLPHDSIIDARLWREGTTVLLSLQPSVPVELASDDWMASGIDVWVARQTLDRLGAELVEPLEPDAPWIVRIG